MKLNNSFCILRCLLPMLTFIVFFNPSFSQVWSPLGSGTNGTINAVVVYNNELIAGGAFTSAGGQLINRIARWNGTNWLPLGLGTNDEVNALGVYGGYLIAAGKFATAGGISASKIARWNGANWTAVSPDFINGDVLAVAVYGSNLVAAGNFTSIGGINMNRISQWNGSSWQPMGSGFGGDVLALASYNSLLFAGGSFVETHGKRISSWNGSNWLQVGVGIADGSVNSLRIYGSSLAVGGTFTNIGGTTVNRIARWTGSSWAPIGSGFDNGVFALYAAGVNLYAGGNFEYADFLPASKVAVYIGPGWSPLSSGIGGNNTFVKAATGYGGNVIFAGSFSIVGSLTANNIASWSSTLGIKQVEGTVPDKYSLEQNYPNPFNPSTKIQFGLPSNSKGEMQDVRISVFDILGKEISVLVNGKLLPGKYEVEFDGNNLPCGTYFYKLVTVDFTSSNKMIILK